MNIEEIKNKILQLAIEGKLVKQNPNDTPASVLLEEIKAEKERLIKEKKIKKEKALPEITEEEKSFVLPEGWEWCRLNDVCRLITDGTHSTPKYTDSGVPFISVKDITKGFIDFSDTRFISKEEHEILIKRCKPEFKDVLLTKVGTTGIAKIVDTEKEFSIFVSIALLKLFNMQINEKYIELLINSPFVKKQSEANTQGVGNKNLVIRCIKNFIIPVPPLEEQKRIVHKVEELFAIVHELNENKEEMLKNIANTRNKVLQLAVQGKLVEQRKEDKPARELLEEIKAEKEKLIKEKVIKKEKALPEITEEEKSFVLPEGWEWCRLGEISNFINGDRGKNYPSKKDLVDSGIPFINAGHLINGKISLNTMNYILEDKFNDLNSGKIQKNDLIYCLRGTLGKNSIVDNLEIGAIASSLVIIRCISLNLINIKYLYYFINSPLALIQIDKYNNGSAQPNLSSESVKNFVLTLPPLEEQKRIVHKVDEVVGHLDELEKLV